MKREKREERKQREKRGVKDIIGMLWYATEEAQSHVAKAKSPGEKRQWLKIIVEAANIIFKLEGVEQPEDEEAIDLTQLLDEAEKIRLQAVKFIKRDKSKDDDSLNPLELKEGQKVKVIWLDACMTFGVRKITNKAFATYKTNVGVFKGIYDDARYKVQHLILVVPQADGSITSRDGSYTILSFPLCIVKKIKPVITKTEKMTFKGISMIPMLVPSWKIKHADHVEALAGGGVKATFPEIKRMQTMIYEDEDVCAHCGGPWDPEADAIIGDRTFKRGIGKLTGHQIEALWIELGYLGEKICSECFFK